MKTKFKLLSVILSLVVVLGSFNPALAVSTDYGDLNSDGSVTAADALLALQQAVGKITLSDDKLILADVDANGKVNASDALLILQFAVGKIKEFDAMYTPEERYYMSRDRYYSADYSDFTDVYIPEDYTDPSEVVEELGVDDYEASAVRGYGIDRDNRLVYDRISRDTASQMDAKYKNVEKVSGTLQVGNSTLNYTVPTKVDAYDAVPIEYTITSSNSYKDPVYLETTAYEVDGRSGDEDDYYDCTLPGDISVDFEYLGHVNATNDYSQKPKLNYDTDLDVQGTAFPAYETEDLVLSGTVDPGDQTWFKFKYTNTGKTILDGEGNGAFNFYCYLYRKVDGGGYELYSTTPNWYQPLLDYLYPGESGEMWLYFNQNYSAIPDGDYRIIVTGLLRNTKGTYSYSDTLLYNTEVTRATYDFTVKKGGEVTEPKSVKNTRAKNNVPRCGFIGVFEEFLTSFNTHSMSQSVGEVKGKQYIQVASFTEQLRLKLINGNLDEIDTVCIPVTVNTDNISIELNPYNENYYVKSDGTRTPLVMTQNMVDMRGNVDRGPYIDETAVNELRNMKEAGINYITTTESATGDYSGLYDMTMFMLDCARQMELDVEGHALYPYRNPLAESRLKTINPSAKVDKSYTDIFGMSGADSSNGLLARINLIRYGDLYHTSSNGIVPISIEDNFGWLSFYLNIRYGINSNKSFVNPFREWLGEAYYFDIDALNERYGSDYEDFDVIDPAAEAVTTDAGFGGTVVMNNTENTYHDWTAATEDMDLFRTIQRVKYYNTMLESMDVENAKIAMRTENAIFMAPGIDPDTTNVHYRSSYYESRHAALIPEILIASGIFWGDSSYCGLAYTPEEFYELTRQAAKYGMNTAKTAEYHCTYDIVPNPVYGSKEDAAKWNIADGQLACNIVSTNALFTSWKAIYEAGGVPGTMWMDYGCDTLVTSTQYKEIQFFTQKVNEMLATEEGKEWAENFDKEEGAHMGIVKGANSFDEAFIEEKLKTIPRYNRIINQHHGK